MCEFISAVKAKDKKGKDKYYFLTHDLIHNTPRGEIIQKQFPGDGEIIGHSAIRSYFNLQSNEGSGWECADFSTPKNFPAVIVKALKRGEFKGFPLPKGLLSKSLHDKYWADLKSLHDKYWADLKPLDDKYQADLKSLHDKYWADLKPLDDKYWADRKSLDDKYQADRKPLDDKYQADRKSLHDKYWDLFTIPENRAEAWR